MKTHLVAGALCAIVLSFTGCRSGKPQIEEVTVRPASTVTVGGRVELSASAREMPPGTTYRFVVQIGQCMPPEFPELLTTFCAPQYPGEALIRIEAVSNGKVIAVRACKVSVVSPGGQTAPPAPIVAEQAAFAVAAPVFYLHENGFIPSGWMGDGMHPDRRFVQYEPAWTNNPHSPPLCEKWSYTIGDMKFAGVAWQYPPNNFGDSPGKNLSNRGFTKVTWYARGAEGGEEIEFFAGGNTGPEKPYQSSFAKISKMIALSRDWQPCSLDLSNLDLSSVLCGFGWVAVGSERPITFFLDDIEYQ